MVVNAKGDGNWSEGDAFVGVQQNLYWSATENDPSHAWRANLHLGNVVNDTKNWTDFVWPVRGGQ